MSQEQSRGIRRKEFRRVYNMTLLNFRRSVNGISDCLLCRA